MWRVLKPCCSSGWQPSLGCADTVETLVCDGKILRGSTAETTSGVQSLNGFTTATPASMKWR